MATQQDTETLKQQKLQVIEANQRCSKVGRMVFDRITYLIRFANTSLEQKSKSIRIFSNPIAH